MLHPLNINHLTLINLLPKLVLPQIAMLIMSALSVDTRGNCFSR